MSPQPQPNILFLFSDQQRWDTLGCYGQQLDITPNLDEMASEGVKFENAFTCQPVCGPSRASLQTGKYPTEINCYRNNKPLPMDQKTLAHYLSDRGYEVGYIGKWHLASETTAGIDYQSTAIPPERRGGYKDYWIASDVLEFTSHGYDGYLFNQAMEKVDFSGYRVDAITDIALEYLRSRKREKPFFMFVSYIEPHHQNDHKHYEGPTGSKERFKDYVPPGDLMALGDGDWREEYPDYLGCCASLDKNVGRIRSALDSLNLTDNTLVFYTSDHGSHFRTRNRQMLLGSFDDYKRSCHEASIRIPLIINGPGFKGGKSVNHELVSLIDLPPTILEAAGVKLPEAYRGRALQGLVDGSATDWPQEVFIQISESRVGRAIRTKQWKYSVSSPSRNGYDFADSDVYVEDHLYDLSSDPFELDNLVCDPAYAGVRLNLAEILKRRMIEIGEVSPEILPKEVDG